MEHEQLKIRAIEAIEEVILDGSVDVWVRRESLQELREVIVLQLGEYNREEERVT